MVRGVDGCKGGWLAISMASAGSEPIAQVFRDAASLFAADGYEVTAIDIPIGLPATGPRECDLEARRRLQERGCCVFPAPIRAVLPATSHAQACMIAKRVCGKGVPIQAFSILAKIREVDTRLRNDRSLLERVREVHPEVCFAQWNAGMPMPVRKKLSRGFELRRALVDREYPGVVDRVQRELRGTGVARDDILDAFAALWSALRIKANKATQLGSADARDEVGLPMNIWV